MGQLRRTLFAVIWLAPPLAGCRPAVPASLPAVPPPVSPRSMSARIVAAARDEVRRGVTYDASYQTLAYPGGDVARDRGACTDVVIRALRAAGYDLQKLVREDMGRRWSAYPHRYGLARPDPSIDHRRVPNLRVFFAKYGDSLPLSTTGPDGSTWKAGDIVFWTLTGGVLDHCGVVTDTRGPSGLPTVVHNIGAAAEEDCLPRWRITGHIRFPKERGSKSGRRRG